MSLDICAYSIVRFLSDFKERQLDEEANLADWLKNIALFAATFFKRFFTADILPLLTYLLNKMRLSEEYISMSVL